MASGQFPLQRAAAAGLCLMLFFAVRSDSRPSHLEAEPGVASPAMLAFFGARPAEEIPEATNATDPAWAVAGRAASGRAAPEWIRGEGHRRTSVQVAGVICGVIGVALLAATAVGFVLHARRSEGAGFGLGTLMGRREVRLGSAC